MLAARIHTCLVAALLLFVASDVGASVRKAKKHFRKAELHYRLGRFQEALDEYSKAYEAKAMPAFLFNIAQCHMELGNYERAAFFYEGFLREKPRSPNRKLVEERLADAKKELARIEEEKRQKEVAAQRAREEEAERARKAEEERIAAEKARAAREARAAEEARARAAALELERHQAAEAHKPAVYETWWFWTAIGGAVAAITAGAIIAMSGGETRTVLPSGDIGTIDGRP